MSDLVIMTHPELGVTRQVPRRQFETTWVNSGWVLQSEAGFREAEEEEDFLTGFDPTPPEDSQELED